MENLTSKRKQKMKSLCNNEVQVQILVEHILFCKVLYLFASHPSRPQIHT